MDDETLWKRRFLIFMAARLFGVATFILGVAIAYGDLLREGGHPTIGAVLIIVGVIDAVFAPKLLKRHWDTK